MHFIEGTNRDQLQFHCLNDNISADDPVRLIDGFVDHLSLSQLGITATVLKAEGRPPFHPSVLLKLYLYGYLNRIRSSRKLEKECYRNIEVRWLLKELTPNYHTIADFRKDQPKTLKQLFKLFVVFLHEQKLLGGELIAVDGSKFRAQNSKKNNYNQSKIDRHLTYIDAQTEAYLKELEQMDSCEAGHQQQELPIQKQKVVQGLKKLQERKAKYQQFQKQLTESKQTQISTTDPDSRALPTGGNVVAVGYNVQTAVDAKHNLIIGCEATNEGDEGALAAMSMQAKEMLQVDELTVLADTGYHNGTEIVKCEKAHITTLVAPGGYTNSSSKMHPDYYTEKFSYNAEADTYRCPQGHTLLTSGKWHDKKRRNGSVLHRFKKYRTAGCATCAVKHLCTARAKGGREIERSEHQDAVARNNTRVTERKEDYKRRQAIVEHPFGTIKRSWGYTYTLVSGKEKVGGEMALIFLCYNLKRAMSIMGVKELLKMLTTWTPAYQKATCIAEKRLTRAYNRQNQAPCILLLQNIASKMAA